jgi:hypothetical protein
LDHINKKYNM